MATPTIGHRPAASPPHPDTAVAADATEYRHGPPGAAAGPSAARRGGHSVPNRLLPSTRSVAALLLLQVLLAPVVIHLAGRGLDAWQLVVTWAAATAALLLVPVGGLPVVGRLARWRQWRARVRRLRRLRHGGGNPLSALTDGVAAGTVVGPRSSELGVVTDAAGWACALEAREPDDPVPGDWLSRVLALRPAAATGVRTLLVFRYAAAGRNGLGAAMSAWLVVRAAPVPGAAPAVAARGLPGVLRGQVRTLVHGGHDLGLELVPLGRDDLVTALATTTDIPLTTPADNRREVREGWLEWSAGGRSHRSLEVVRRRPWEPRGALDVAVGCVASMPGAALTAALHLDSDDPGTSPLVLRLSHRSDATTASGVAALRRALASEGYRTRRLAGVQGPAVLSTSLLGDPVRR